MEKERDYLFDNIKGLLIFLVVFGHLIEYFKFKGTNSIDFIYLAIYVFHMPVFVFISGYFSKKNNKKRILELILIYIIWQMVVYPLFVSIFTNTSLLDNIQSVFLPKWTYWYIFSLITWKIITPYFERIRFSFAISILMGILIGYSTIKSGLGNLSLGRTVAFYPFFLLGYYCTKEKFYYYKNKINKYIGVIGFILIMILSLVILYHFDKFTKTTPDIGKILYLKDAYKNYMTNNHIGALARAIFYVIQFLCIPLLFSFIPTKKNILSKLGQNSLFIYITHAMVLYVIRKNIFDHIQISNGSFILVGSFLFTLIYCLLLSLNPISNLGRKITSLNMNKILKNESDKNGCS